jgi:hypothetical protein
MAVWQVDFAIVPRRALALNPRVPIEGILAIDWWSAERLPPGFAQQLAAGARVGASTSAERQTWGEEEGNRVDVWFENGRAARMTAHVDVRRLDAKFGAIQLQLARVADAEFVRADGLVVEPQVGAFGAALRSSPAWQYGVDPATFLSTSAEPDDE